MTLETVGLISVGLIFFVVVGVQIFNGIALSRQDLTLPSHKARMAEMARRAMENRKKK